ncbi:MAG: NADPH-dependent F420 reductase [Rhodospirillaceae bacterium]
MIGGTGKQGYGLALRWAAAGHDVIVGSRDAVRAKQAAAEIEARGVVGKVAGADNVAAAEAAGIVVLAVPFAAQEATIAPLKDAVAGKLVVDVTAPLVPPRVGTVQLPEGGSAVLNTQRILGEAAIVVAAFQNIAAQHLADLDHDIECDVLVCGDKRAARDTVIQLAADAGMTGWHAGPLANAVAAEAMTAVLISINRHHGIPGSGIRITGTPQAEE